MVTGELLRRGMRSLAALLPVQSNQHASRARPGGPDELDRLALGAAVRDHVVHDEDPALQGGADDAAALAVVLGLLAVEAERHIVTETGKRGGGDRGERDALVRGPEEHVEGDARGEGRP